MTCPIFDSIFRPSLLQSPGRFLAFGSRMKNASEMRLLGCGAHTCDGGLVWHTADLLVADVTLIATNCQ
jgi:predicted metal-binding transcription factor (methanogenesis marker protein 9)